MHTHYRDMGVGDLGDNCTEADLRKFREFCSAAERLHPEIEDITSAVWADGDWEEGARRLGVDVEPNDRQVDDAPGEG